MNNIILVGMMGAGKTSVGKVLVRELSNYKFIDVDSYIEDEEGISIPEMFERYTEIGFRRIEEETINELSQGENLIISTGGGSFESPKNRKVLLSSGKVFYLSASAEVLYDRIKSDGNRPMLYCENPKQRLVDLLKVREKNYKEAHYTINTLGLDEVAVAKEVLRRFNDTVDFS